MKLALKALALFIVVIFGLVAFAPRYIDWSHYKGAMVQYAQDKTGYDIIARGKVGFSILPSPYFFIEDVTVSNPTIETDKEIISFDRLDLRLDIMPLFSGTFSVSSASLLRPIINIVTFEGGSNNVQLQHGEEQQGSHNTAVSTLSESSIANIGIDRVEIDDALVTYIDKKNDQSYEIHDIKIDAQAAHLFGPYKATGSGTYGEYENVKLSFESTGYIDKDKSLPVKLAMQIDELALSSKFSGVFDLSDTLLLQGDLIFQVNDMNAVLVHQGIESLFQENTSWEAQGIVLITPETLRTDKISMMFGEQLIDMSAEVNVNEGSFDTHLKTEKAFSLSKLFKNDWPINHVSLDTKFFGNKERIGIKKGSTLILDDQNVMLDLVYDFTKDRPLLSLSVDAKKLNFARITPSHDNQDSTKDNVVENDVMQYVDQFSLPFDVQADLRVAEIIMAQNQNINGLDTSFVFKSPKAILSHLKVNDYLGASLNMSGNIGNVNTLSDIDLYADSSIKGVKLFNYYDIATANVLTQNDTVSFKTHVTGSYDGLNMVSNVDVLGASILVKGAINDVINGEAFSDIAVQLKHPNMAKFAKRVMDVDVPLVNSNKAIDFYTVLSSQKEGHYTFNSIKADFSGVSMKGDLDYNAGKYRPKIKGTLNFGDIKFASDVGHNGSHVKQDRNHSNNASPWSKDIINTEAFHALDVSLDVQANTIACDTWLLMRPKLNVIINNGVLDISSLQANIFDGQFKGVMRLETSAEKRQPLHFKGNMTFSDVNIEELSTAIVDTPNFGVSGSSNVDVDIRASGASVAALVMDSHGAGKIQGHDIVLHGIDVDRFARALSYDSRPGDTITGLWQSVSSGGKSPFDTLSGVFNIKDGIVSTQDLLLDSSKNAIKTVGHVDLPSWTLQTDHSIETKAEGDALADIPPYTITLKGDLSNPAQTIGQNVLQDYLNRKIKRKLNKIISEKLNRGDASTAVDQEQDEAPTDQNNAPQSGEEILEDIAEDALKNVLDGLF